jgi:hypothetical protein
MIVFGPLCLIVSNYVGPIDPFTLYRPLAPLGTGCLIARQSRPS